MEGVPTACGAAHAVHRLGGGIIALQTTVGHNRGAAVDVQFGAALGIGIQRHFRRARRGHGKHVTAGKREIAVGVNGVSLGGVGVHIAARNGETALTVDGVVGTGSGVKLSAGDGEVALHLDGLALGSAGQNAAATHHKVAAVEVRVAAFLLVSNLDGLARNIVGLAAGSLDGKGSSGDVTVREGAVVGIIVVIAGTHTLSAASGIGDGHRAARHAKVIVGLDAGGAGVFTVFGVIGHPAAHVDGGGSALHQHVVVGSDAFLHIGLGGDAQNTVRELHVLVGLDAVAGAGARRHGDGGTGEHTHVVVGHDAALALGVARRHGELARPGGGTAEDELALREKHALHILVGGGGIGGR